MSMDTSEASVPSLNFPKEEKFDFDEVNKVVLHHQLMKLVLSVRVLISFVYVLFRKLSPQNEDVADPFRRKIQTKWTSKLNLVRYFSLSLRCRGYSFGFALSSLFFYTQRGAVKVLENVGQEKNSDTSILRR